MMGRKFWPKRNIRTPSLGRTWLRCAAADAGGTIITGHNGAGGSDLAVARAYQPSQSAGLGILLSSVLSGGSGIGKKSGDNLFTSAANIFRIFFPCFWSRRQRDDFWEAFWRDQWGCPERVGRGGAPRPEATRPGGLKTGKHLVSIGNSLNNKTFPWGVFVFLRRAENTASKRMGKKRKKKKKKKRPLLI